MPSDPQGRSHSQRMETAGLIRAQVVLLDPERLGLGVRAISYVALTRLQGVANIRSNIVLQCSKSTTALPLSHLGG